MSYSASSAQVVTKGDESKVGFTLNLGCTDNGYMATELNVELYFYQNGIMRAHIDQPDSTRFRISQEDLPIEWSQLKPLSEDDFNTAFAWTEDGFTMTGIKREVGEGDIHDYEVSMSPFEIRQLTNGEVTARTYNQIYFENGSAAATPSESNDSTCYTALTERAKGRSGMDIYGQDTTSTK